MRQGLLLTLPFVLCAGGAAPGQAQRSDSGPGGIEGPVYKLLSLGGQHQEALAGLARGVWVRFAAGRVEGSSGCNTISGTYRFEGGALVLGPLAGTMMACPEPAASLETAFRAAFAGALAVAREGERLTLTGANGRALVFAPEPPPALEGVTWEVTGYNNGKGGVTSPVGGAVLTVRFAAGTASGRGGCNTYRADYTVSGDRLEIATPAATARACADEAVMEQERAFFAALASARSFSIREGRLELRREDGARALAARPTGSP